MPELPEVETVKRGLWDTLGTRRVTGARVFRSDIFRNCTATQFQSAVRGKCFQDASRRGKYLLLSFWEPKRSAIWVVHLGMSGQLLVTSGHPQVKAHTHVILTFSEGYQLHFVDPRRFGRLYLIDGAKPEPLPSLAGLGPEPLQGGWKSADLARVLRGRRAAIKTVLMDQRVLAGLGNIYAAEACFRAKIHPARPAGGLDMEEIKRLHRAIGAVLREAIRHGGSSVDSAYVKADGAPGGFQDHHRVYGRGGLPCPRCRAPVQRIVLGQRSTYLCPNCQPLSGGQAVACIPLK